VFMDNASVHKAEEIEEAVAARGATLFYIPAYSPDFNPIEQFFAKLKSILRKIAAYTLKGIAFTVDRLCKAIASCLDQHFNLRHDDTMTGYYPVIYRRPRMFPVFQSTGGSAIRTGCLINWRATLAFYERCGC
jgi:hypothetical protein